MNHPVFLPALAWLALSAGTATGADSGAPGDPARLWGRPIETPAEPALEAEVEKLLAALSLEQKIGQILQAELHSITPGQAARYSIGSILNGGGSFPGRRRRAGLAAWQALAADFHRATTAARADGRPAVPVLWGSDAVHGHNNVFGATIFPHNIALGATGDADLVRRITRATAREVRATGIGWTFAPTVAVARDPRWGRTYESFSSDPELVARLGQAAVEGLQGRPGRPNWLGDDRVLATAKHFVGDGGTTGGVDQGDTRLSEADLARIHGRPFRAALAGGVQSVMASFSSWNGTKMHAHRYLLTDILKRHLGFDGIVVGDWNGHAQIPGCSVDDCLAALEAGIDLFMVPEDWQAMRNRLLEHARAGRLPRARLDDAVRRILRVKLRAGLFHARPESDAPAGQPLIPPPGHRALAREAVRKSLVLLKNNGQVLPLDARDRLLVVGHGADDIGRQAGGWTLEWQGVTDANEDFPHGQTIFSGLAGQVRAAGGAIALGEAAAAGFRPDAVIAVIGERPYAEGRGDRGTLEHQPGEKPDLALLERMRALRVPVVTVFLSGRPLWVNPELNASDAFVAAWLPGSQGGGVADVLLTDAAGRAHHAPAGRLPFAWPARPVPAAGDVLFKRGFGLDYGPVDDLPALSERGQAPIRPSLDLDGSADVTLFDGRANGPWRLTVGDPAGWEIPADTPSAQTAGDPPLRLAPTDRHVQGDARRVHWPGGRPAAVMLVSSRPLDLTPLVERGATLAFDLRAESAPASLALRVECGWPCAGEIDLESLIADPATDRWQRLRIDLRCLARAGADLARVERAFVLAADTAGVASFADVRLERDTVERATLRCSDAP